MTQALGQTTRIEPVRQALDAMGHKRHLFAWLARLLRCGWTWGALGLIVLLIDAAWPMPQSLRLAVAVTMGLVLVVALILSRPRWGDPNRQPLHDARSLERHHKLHNNPLLNALWLSRMAENKDASLATQLAKRSVARGNDLIEQVDGEVLIDRESLWRERGWLWAIFVVWIVVLMIQPRLIFGGLFRFVYPFGDTPPFSMTEFDVQIDPNEVFEGDDVSVLATITGRVPAMADLVELDEQGQELRRWPMSAFAGGQFERKLLSMTEPMTFQIEAGAARSKRFTIDPKPRPLEPEPESLADEPPETELSEPQRRQLDGMMRELDLDDPDLKRIVEAINELAKEAQQLREQSSDVIDAAQQAQRDGWNEQSWQDVGEQLQKLDSDTQAFSDKAKALAAECRALADVKDAQGKHDVADMLRALAALLENLGLCEGGNCPNPGPFPGTGVGSGFGFSHGGVTDSGTPGGWLLVINSAALVDGIALDSALARLIRALISQSAGGSDSDAIPYPDQVRAATAYYERAAEAARQRLQPDAIMQQVPPIYRELVGKYFDRVSEEPMKKNMKAREQENRRSDP